MFEVWESAEDPSSLLIFRESISFPGWLAVDDWAMAGVCHVTDEIAGKVDLDGYMILRIDVPFNPNEVLGPGAARA